MRLSRDNDDVVISVTDLLKHTPKTERDHSALEKAIAVLKEVMT